MISEFGIETNVNELSRLLIGSASCAEKVHCFPELCGNLSGEASCLQKRFNSNNKMYELLNLEVETVTLGLPSIFLSYTTTFLRIQSLSDEGN